MKKNLLFIFLLGSATLFAQVSEGYRSKDGNLNKVDAGIQSGPSIIFIRGDRVLSQFQKPALSYSGGISFQYNFSKIIQIHTEINYERKGSLEKTPFYLTDQYGNVTGTVT